MESPIVALVEEFFESRKSKILKPESYYLKKLTQLGVSNEKAKDIFLKIDDEWTTYSHTLLKLKNAKMIKYSGIGISIFAALITLLSYLGVLFKGDFYIIFYGSFVSGILMIIKGNSIVNEMNSELEKRKFEWKSWLREPKN